MAGRTAIGLDIGTSVVRAVELSYGRGGITLERFGQVVLPAGAIRDGEVVDSVPVTAALRQLWGATGFSHKRVVLGVANQRVIVRKLSLPWMAPAELRQALPYHVEQFLPIPLEQALLDFFPIEETTDGAGVRALNGLLVAASRDTVTANLNAVQAAGLTPLSVDLTSFAVLRALGKQTQAQVETEALIDIGARITNVIIHSGGVPRFVRIVLMGGQDITDAVAAHTGLATAQAEALKFRPGMLDTEPEPLPVLAAAASYAVPAQGGRPGELPQHEWIGGDETHAAHPDPVGGSAAVAAMASLASAISAANGLPGAAPAPGSPTPGAIPGGPGGPSGTGGPGDMGSSSEAGSAAVADAGLQAAAQQAVSGTVGDFLDEIRQSLDYYAVSGAGAPVERILLSGGGSRLGGLADRLAQATRLPVQAGDPMANLRIGRTGLDETQIEFIRPLAAVPVGLALGAM